MTILFFSSIPKWLDNKLLIELFEAFGKIKLFKRPMDSKGIYLDFLFTSYEEDRAVYYLLRYLIGIEIGNTKLVSNCLDIDNIPEEIIVQFETSFNLDDKRHYDNQIRDCPDKEISFKLHNVINNIQWSLKIYEGLSLLNSGRTLKTLKLNKIEELRKRIEQKLRKKPVKVDYDKTKAFLDKFG